MVEKYDPIPFKDRPSQNIGLRHYWKEIRTILAITAAGAVAGWVASKKKLVKSSPAVSAFIGGKGTAIISAFLIWRKKEKARIGVEEIYKEIKSVESMHQTDDDLIRDNAVLTKMIAYEKCKQEKLSDQTFAERVTEKPQQNLER